MTKKCCCMCWRKELSSDSKSHSVIQKADLKKCLMYLKYINHSETSAATDNDDNVWLCLRCLDQCNKILSFHNEIEAHTNLMKIFTETYTSCILYHRNQNRPNAAMFTLENVDATSDATGLPYHVLNETKIGNMDNTRHNPSDKFVFIDGSNAKTANRHVSTRNFVISYGSAPFICKNCRIQYDSYQNLIDHICAMVSECLVCKEVFNTQQAFIKHKNQYDKCFLCDHFTESFHFEKFLTRHQIEQHEGTQVPSDIRHQHQVQNENLFRHPASNWSFPSENQPSLFKTNTRLNVQSPSISTSSLLQINTIVENETNDRHNISTRKPKKSYECGSCSIFFPKLKLFRIHCFDVHGINNEYATQVKCKICEKYVRYCDELEHLRSHLRIQ